MTLREKLIFDIRQATPELLAPLFEFFQLLKKHIPASSEKKNHPVLELAGSLSDDDAKEISATIDGEFSHLEGDW